jgi:hypothetical protein
MCVMTVQVDAIDPDEIAQALDALYAQSGEARYSHAARLARGDLLGGRQECDDGEELAMVQAEIASGRWPSERQACAAVARRISAPEKVRAMTYRLHRKHKKNRHKRVFVPPDPV